MVHTHFIRRRILTSSLRNASECGTPLSPLFCNYGIQRSAKAMHYDDVMRSRGVIQYKIFQRVSLFVSLEYRLSEIRISRQRSDVSSRTYFNRRFDANSPPRRLTRRVSPRGFLLLASLLRIKQNFDKVAGTLLQRRVHLAYSGRYNSPL